MKTLEKIVWKVVNIGLVVAGIALADGLEDWIYYNVYPGALSSDVRTVWTVVIFLAITLGLMFIVDAIHGKIEKVLAAKKEENEKIKEIIKNYDEFMKWKETTRKEISSI